MKNCFLFLKEDQWSRNLFIILHVKTQLGLDVIYCLLMLLLPLILELNLQGVINSANRNVTRKKIKNLFLQKNLSTFEGDCVFVCLSVI